MYITPEKLLLGNFLSRVSAMKERIGLVAIDEAHCVSQWGHDFRPEYMKLGRVRDILGPSVPIMALTATAVPNVQGDIIRALKLRAGVGGTEALLHVAKSSFDRHNLAISVRRKGGGGLASTLAPLLKQFAAEAQMGPLGSTLIYVPTQAETMTIAAYLRDNVRVDPVGSSSSSSSCTSSSSSGGGRALDVRSYHGGMTMTDRESTHRAFLTGACPVVVCTLAFGMGIDKPDVRRVVHFGPPQTVEQYYQEIGRAGRDGLSSECIMWVINLLLSHFMPGVSFAQSMGKARCFLLLFIFLSVATHKQVRERLLVCQVPRPFLHVEFNRGGKSRASSKPR